MAVTLDELGGWRPVLLELTAGRDLSADQAHAAMTEILAGTATDAQIAAYIVALRMKGEGVDEVSGMVDAMLEASDPIDLGPQSGDAVDIVGTGGGPSRQAHALNVSTMACFVAAAAGAPVCKHGNRKASSTSGSFDLLEALGVGIDLDGAGVARCVADAGVGFCYARAFHPAMRHAGPVRAELGIPTLFNFLGPLSNPARVSRQVIGVNDPAMAPTVVGVLQRRGSARAMVVHGHDGMDELTITGRSSVWEVRDGDVLQYELDPAALGLHTVDADQLRGGDAETNAAIARSVFDARPGAQRDIVALNAAAGLVVGGRADDFSRGLALAYAAIDDGRAAGVLDRLRVASNLTS